MKKKKLIIAICFVLILIPLAIYLVYSNTVENKDEDNVDSSKDKHTKVAIVVQDKSENYLSFDAADTLVKEKAYARKHGNTETNAEMYVLPKNFNENKNKVDDIFDSIKKDKDVNILVVSSNKSGLLSNIEDLKAKRKDILVISANLNEDNNELIDKVDLNFKTRYTNRGQKIVELSKSLGAEKFVCMYDKNDISNPENSARLNEMKSTANSEKYPFEEVIIPDGLSVDQKREFVADKIDELLRVNGSEVNFYTFDENLDKVLLTKQFQKNFYVAEFSKPNISHLMMDVFSLDYVSRQSHNYDYLNSEIVKHLSRNGIERKMGSISVVPEAFIIKFASELGVNIKAKEMKTSTAYNSYFLEKVSRIRCRVESGFINIKSNIGNFKYVEPDQFIY